MKKSNLVVTLAKRLKITHRSAQEFVDAFLDEVAKALARGEKVKLAGFGVFWTRLFKDKMVLPIGAKAKKKIPARRMPRFTPGSQLKRQVR